MASDALPGISLIIPAWNRAETIERAISSIARADVPLPFEVIIVDDGSDDDTAGAAERAVAAAGIAGARVLRQANAGPGAARNTGAAAAGGDYLAFLDSDDFWFPWTLRHLAAALAGGERPALVFLRTVNVVEGETPAVEEAAPGVRRFAGFAEATASGLLIQYGSGNAVVRRDLFEALGGFTTETRCSEDLDLFLRAAQHSGPHGGGCALVAGTPQVAVTTGRGDSLAGNFPYLRAGLQYLLAQDRRGAYPDPAGPKAGFLAKVVAYTIRIGFATGYPMQAYALYLRHFPLLVAGRNWHWLARLPATPLLSLLRPASFPFRLAPKRT
jgi:hypothetical protein